MIFLYRSVQALRAFNLLCHIGPHPLNDRIALERLLPSREGSTHLSHGTSPRPTKQIRPDPMPIAYLESGPMPLRHSLSKTVDTTPLGHLSILHEYAGVLFGIYLPDRLPLQNADTTSHSRLVRQRQHIDIQTLSIRCMINITRHR